jgi:integrase
MKIDFVRLQDQRALLEAAILAPRTVRAYAYGWLHFTRWCEEAGVVPLPCTSETLALYIVAAIDRGLRVATVALHVSAVGWNHRDSAFPSPADDSIRKLLTAIRRTLKQKPRAKRAITAEQILESSRLPDSSTLADRDRALLILGFATGLRRAELAALDFRDLEFVPEGLKVTIRASKTDQEGAGREVGIWPGRSAESCPVRTVQHWLVLRGSNGGPLFPQVTNGGRVTEDRLSGEGVSRAVKRRVKKIGLDPAAYGGHSLRAGCVTAAVKAGASVLAIMQRTGHKSVQTIHRYVRPATAFDVNPLSGVL